MIDQQEKEYNSVIMAALLHDIGKLLHRSKPGYDGKHAMASGDFIDANETKCKLTNELYDLNLVEWLVRFHHSPEEKVDGTKKKVWSKEKILEAYSDNRHTEQEIDRTRLWSYMKIVRDADGYSCAERDYGDQKRTDADKRTAPLDSIFESISIVGEKENGVYRYLLNTINPLSNFPKHLSYLDNLAAYIGEFKNAFPDLTVYSKLNHVLSAILSFLERYTWCVPSDTRYSRADISLFDHLRSSAAIAACLYKRHYHKLGNSNFETRNNEFVLIAGDFSGIQNYIFDVTNRCSDGTAKRLRARSFFIQIFCEATIHKILHALELPLVCNLFSAGGKFILLAPSGNDVEEKLIRTKAEIQKEIHTRYFNQFSFLMAYRNIEKYRPNMDIGNFCEIADNMFHLLEMEKLQSSQSVFLSNEEDEHSENKKKKKWNQAAFSLSDDEFQKYAENGDCSICGKGPGEFSERSGTEEDPVTIQVCRVCHMNKEIGKILPKKQFVCFGKGKGGTNKIKRITLFHENDNGKAYYVDLSDEAPASDDYYLIWNLNNDKKGMTIDRWPLVRKNLANHVLTDEDGSVVSFEDLARRSRWKNTEDSKEYGSDFLGVLKADVDNLGLVFSKGFDTPERPRDKRYNTKEGELPLGTDARSVSRFLTLSRMLELFFSGWIGSIMEKDAAEIQQLILDCQPDVDINLFQQYLDTGVIDFKNIYTVYSGGDDLVLIGPWETMIIFAILLNAKFREYTCQSKSFTLSAGLAFVKPKFPIATAIREADALLEKSKSEGKNRITILGTTVEWNQLPELLNFFLFLDSRLKDKNSNINMSFLYRLLDYHQMALTYIDEDKIDGLKFASALNYDLGRNIYSRDEKQDKKKRNEEIRQIHELLNIKKKKNSLMYKIKPCVFWSLYRSRSVH